MKVLLVVHQFFPEFAAGTEVLSLSVARELVARGHTVRVLTGHPAATLLRDDQRCDSYEFEGLHVDRFHHDYRPMGQQSSAVELGYDNRLAAALLRRILGGFRPDVLHFFHFNRLGTGLIDEAVAAGVPAFFTPTDFWAICPTARLSFEDGRPCTGPSAHAGNCVLHFAQTAQAVRSPALGWLARHVPVALADAGSRWTVQGRLPPYPKQGEVRAMAQRLNRNITRLNRLTRILAPTTFMRDTLLHKGVQADKLAECSYGIDLPEGAATTPARAARPRGLALRVGFIGTLAPHKGAHVLVDAVRQMGQQGVAVELSIYGKPDEFPDYVQSLHVAAGQHAFIRFCGTFANERIGAVLADMDVLVVPSLWPENTPLVLHSAQAARCPVVASDFPGISAVVEHGRNGLLFTPGNANALVDALMLLTTEHALLPHLSAQTRAPKSARQYVDDLLAHWQGVLSCEN